MIFREIRPQAALQPYIRSYWWMDGETPALVNDTILPSGYPEIVFNLSNAIWESVHDGKAWTNPPIELIGQITQPTPISTKGHVQMLGVRFHPHTAAFFLKTGMAPLNDGIHDLSDVLNRAKGLHEALLHVPGLENKISLIEQFLLEHLPNNKRQVYKLQLLDHVLQQMQQHESVDTIAYQCNISARYLQQLFMEHLGISPRMYLKIRRFKKSMRYLNQQPRSLTSVAYECGYFDQAHFIRDFKSFTGVTPSAYKPEQFPVNQLFH